MVRYLRFPDEHSFQELALSASLFTSSSGPDGEDDFVPEYYHLASHDHGMDIIGTISQGGQWDDETGEELEPPTVLDGWHVNYIGELPEGWDQYLVFPENPVRKFAGVD
jgi:hypothetical protein